MTEVTVRVFDLYHKYGNVDYLGENVSQIEHAILCAMAAESESAPTPTVLGAFLHDIGHLVGQDHKLERMVTGNVTLGAETHDKVGAEFLGSLGVPDEVNDFVRGHVDAKRYLTFKDPDYYDRLSEASKMTLVHQGGPMTEDEACVFEKQPRFQEILKMRMWEENHGKIENAKLNPIEKYETMFQKYMESQK